MIALPWSLQPQEHYRVLEGRVPLGKFLDVREGFARVEIIERIAHFSENPRHVLPAKSTYK